MAALVRSILFSLLASTLATIAVRRILAVTQPATSGNGRTGGDRTVIVIVPVFSGNSNNRIGWVKETHHHHHALFGRKDR